jgi:hypothetical protein
MSKLIMPISVNAEFLNLDLEREPGEIPFPDTRNMTFEQMTDAWAGFFAKQADLLPDDATKRRYVLDLLVSGEAMTRAAGTLFEVVPLPSKAN